MQKYKCSMLTRCKNSMFALLCSVHVTFRHLKAGAICIVVVCKVGFFKCIIANFVVLAKLTVFLIFLDCDLFFCSLFNVHCFLLL